MSAHRARHGASGGGRPVGEILAQLAGGPASATALAPSRSALSAAAAAVVGAGTAAAGITGTFPAINVPTIPGLTGDHAVSQIIGPAPSANPAAAPAAAPAPSPATPKPVARSGPLAPLSVPSHTGGVGATGGTVMATDLHQTHAAEIAALSRATQLGRVTSAGPANRASAPSSGAASRATSGGPATAIGALGSAVSSALSLPSRVGGVPLAGSAASSSAAIAVKSAATKLGRPYVWGAKGPNSFDCSGLMQWAYKQAGVKIPPNSVAQAKAGSPVSVKDLKPGDMVFYYTPVSHVGMYIGNGKILHASEPGKPVKISPVNAFPIHNARRITA